LASHACNGLIHLIEYFLEVAERISTDSLNVCAKQSDYERKMRSLRQVLAKDTARLTNASHKDTLVRREMEDSLKPGILQNRGNGYTRYFRSLHYQSILEQIHDLSLKAFECIQRKEKSLNIDQADFLSFGYWLMLNLDCSTGQRAQAAVLLANKHYVGRMTVEGVNKDNYMDILVKQGELKEGEFSAYQIGVKDNESHGKTEPISFGVPFELSRAVDAYRIIKEGFHIIYIIYICFVNLKFYGSNTHLRFHETLPLTL
jgi:hypothetical protein